MEDLINEMVDAWLRWAWDTDEEREDLYKKVEDWLLDGNNDGSKASVLADRFDEQVGAKQDS